jgi:hypothetical protein
LDGNKNPAGALFAPVLDDDETLARDIIMLTPLHDWIHRKDGSRTPSYKLNIQAFLTEIITGCYVNNDIHFKNWRKRIFEIRVQIAPQHADNWRIFGGFVRADTFVAAVQKPRSYFGGKEDPKWNQMVDEADLLIQQAFPGVRLLMPRPFTDLITSNSADVLL